MAGLIEGSPLWDGDSACTALLSWLLGRAMLPMPAERFEALRTNVLLADLFEDTVTGGAIPVP